MARVSEWIFPQPNTNKMRSILQDILERMEDHYDGAPDAKPSLPFNGNDMEEIRQVLG